MIFILMPVISKSAKCLEIIPNTFGLSHSQLIIKKHQWQSKPSKSEIKAGYYNCSKQEKLFVDGLDIRKSKPDTLPFWEHVDRLTVYGMRKKTGVNLWKAKLCENL